MSLLKGTFSLMYDQRHEVRYFFIHCVFSSTLGFEYVRLD